MSIMRQMSSSSIVGLIAVFLSTGAEESVSGILARTFRGVFANNAFEWVERSWRRKSSETIASESDPFRDYSHCVLVFRRMDFLTEAIFRRSSENAPGSKGRKPGAD
jgi:hypothetical protein